MTDDNLTTARSQASVPDLYGLLGVQVPDRETADEPEPNTILTATIETIDNDRAMSAFAGTGLPLP